MEDQLDLQTLIEHRRRALDLTHPELSRRADAAGYPLSKEMFQYLAKNPVQKISAKTVQAVAAALEVSEMQVLFAAARSMKLHVQRVEASPGSGKSALVASIERPRPPAQADALHTILTSTVEAFDEMRRAQGG